MGNKRPFDVLYKTIGECAIPLHKPLGAGGNLSSASTSNGKKSSNYRNETENALNNLTDITANLCKFKGFLQIPLADGTYNRRPYEGTLKAHHRGHFSGGTVREDLIDKNALSRVDTVGFHIEDAFPVGLKRINKSIGSLREDDAKVGEGRNDLVIAFPVQAAASDNVLEFTGTAVTSLLKFSLLQGKTVLASRPGNSIEQLSEIFDEGADPLKGSSWISGTAHRPKDEVNEHDPVELAKALFRVLDDQIDEEFEKFSTTRDIRTIRRGQTVISMLSEIPES
ncbi:uncharacterized protein IL334_000314 [Kwoniella shivajii]|uniref:Uncharacterized protein n=1 Tax=Kwoniella shivajii TaxID=564305 RepID=A0ABZ1CQA5_9TREE|nr:hypothetical protein IL334_000314 [Kwoniella shivajii]